MRGQINPLTIVFEVAKKVSYVSSSGPPGNCYGVLKEHLMGRHVLKEQNGRFIMSF